MRFIAKSFIALLTCIVMSSLVLGATAETASALTSTKSVKVMDKAAHYKGVKYKWGGTTPKGFDCSGYTQYVFEKSIHKKLGRTAGDQARQGHDVNKSDKKKGDLIVFYNGSGYYHVGIYAGHNKIWHSPRPGKKVSKETIWTSKYKVRRI